MDSDNNPERSGRKSWNNKACWGKKEIDRVLLQILNNFKVPFWHLFLYAPYFSIFRSLKRVLLSIAVENVLIPGIQFEQLCNDIVCVPSLAGSSTSGVSNVDGNLHVGWLKAQPFY